jgi:hypothetical protein
MKRALVLAAAVLVASLAAAGEGTRVETPNRALSFTVPEGWSTKPLANGLALEAPAPAGGRRRGGPLDEAIVVACEPFRLASIEDRNQVEDLLARLRAGQLATCDLERRWHRETVEAGGRRGLSITYEGTDDAGMPAALRIAIIPDDGRVAILTARMPLERLKAREKELGTIVASMRVAPRAEAVALAARLAGTWRSAAAPGVSLRFAEDGTFEETREVPAGGPGRPASKSLRRGVFDVVGREVRLRFDEGDTRAFVVDDEPGPGRFRSAGELWTRS